MHNNCNMFARIDLTELIHIFPVSFGERVKLKPLLTQMGEKVNPSERSARLPPDAETDQGKGTVVSTSSLSFDDVAKTRARFDSLMVESITESITLLLSRNVADALFAHLETRTVTRDQICNHLETIHSILETVFGPGAKALEKDITKRLYMKLGIKFLDDPEMTLANHSIYLKKLQKLAGEE